MRDTPMRWSSMGCMPCKIHACEAALVRDSIWDIHAYEIAYGRGTPIR
jgi:hypothetical protein